MSRALCCLGLKTGSENITLKIYVKLSKRHNIWALSFSEIKWMKCDTSSPLFQFMKSFKSYWVLIQRPNVFKSVYCEWRHFRVQNLMVCVTPFRGQFGVVWTRVGSTYVWQWTPQCEFESHEGLWLVTLSKALKFDLLKPMCNGYQLRLNISVREDWRPSHSKTVHWEVWPNCWSKDYGYLGCTEKCL